MGVTIKQYAESLYQSFSETDPKDYDKVIDNLIKLLKIKGDIHKYQEIVTAYEVLDREKKGIKDVTVTTAIQTELNQTIVTQINDLIGQDINLKHKIDQSLIGGLMIKVDDLLIDGTIKRKINDFKSSTSQ